MSGPRQEKVSDLLQKEIARLLQREVHDARLGFVTVTEVRMSRDLRHARVFVSVMADEGKKVEAFEALDAARGFIRSRIGTNLRLRYTPEITFVNDTSMETGARIETLLRSVLPPSPPEADAGDEEEETDGQ